jgi:hypothetical protein
VGLLRGRSIRPRSAEEARLSIKTVFCSTLAVLVLAVHHPAEAADPTEEACEPVAPAPGPGRWGPAWVRDDLGGLRPQVRIWPLGAAEHHAQVFVSTPEGEVAWTEGPLTPGPDGTILFALDLPEEIDARLAKIIVKVAAQYDGRTVASRAVKAYGYVRDGQVTVLSRPAAEAAAARRRPSDGVAADDTTIDETLVGAEVSR